MIELLKQIRNDSEESSLGLQYGTAQIIDLYENIAIHMILDDYQLLKDENKIQHIIDAAINDRRLPQLDGYDYMKLKNFGESFSNQFKYHGFSFIGEGNINILIYDNLYGFFLTNIADKVADTGTDEVIFLQHSAGKNLSFYRGHKYNRKQY